MSTLAGRGEGRKARTSGQVPDRAPVERHRAIIWAQRLKSGFGIGIETCHACGSAMKIIAGIKDPSVIRKVLDHMDRLAPFTAPSSFGLTPENNLNSDCKRPRYSQNSAVSPDHHYHAQFR